MKNILICLFLGFSAATLAQETHHIRLKPSIKDTIPNRQFYAIAVVDDRPKKIGLGAVEIGDKLVVAKFVQPFSLHLKDVFNELMPYKKGAIPVIIKVSNFSIKEEVEFNKEVGIAIIQLELCYPDTNTMVATIKAIQSIESVDVTKKHPELIMTTIKDCLTQLNELEVIKNLKAEEKIVSFNSFQSLERGLYYNVTELLTNNPQQGISFGIKEIKKAGGKFNRYIPYYQDKTAQVKKKRIKHLFGFCDGQKVYLNAANYAKNADYFVKAKFIGEYIYFEDKVSDTGAAILFGLMGALASIEKVAMVLETQTGKISQLNRDFLVRVLKEYPELREMYNNTNKKFSDRRAILKKLNEVIMHKHQ